MPPLTLYTFAASQSSEKIRWALDASGLPYRERRLTPFLHYGAYPHRSAGLGTSLPVLEADGEMIEDSTRILEWLETHRAPFPLIPQDPVLRTAVMRSEARFDHIGPHVVRCMYATLLDDGDLVQRLWSVDAGFIQAAVLRAAFPVLSRLFRRGLGLDAPALLKHSQGVIVRALDELDRMAEDGRPYLVGEALTVADITAAAHLAPLACPDEHPVFSDIEYRDAIAPLVSRWQARPALAWVRELYRLHRRVRPLRVLTQAPSAAQAFRSSRPRRIRPAGRFLAGR